MHRLIPVIALVGLVACEPMPVDVSDRVLPAEVQAYLLPGQPQTLIVQNSAGCYLISNETTEPRSGYFLRDQSTNEPLCYDRDGMRIPYVAPAPEAPEAAS